MSQSKKLSKSISYLKSLKTPKGFPGIGTRSPMVLRQGAPVDLPNGGDTGSALAVDIYKARLVKALRRRFNLLEGVLPDEEILSITKGSLLRARIEADLAFEDLGQAMKDCVKESKIKRWLNKMGIFFKKGGNL